MPGFSCFVSNSILYQISNSILFKIITIFMDSNTNAEMTVSNTLILGRVTNVFVNICIIFYRCYGSIYGNSVRI